MNELMQFFLDVQNANKGLLLQQYMDNEGIHFVYENGTLSLKSGIMEYKPKNN